MDIVPVSTSSVDQPHEEVTEELANTRDTVCSRNVVGVSESAPVNNDDVDILNGEEGRCDEGVHGGVSIAVPAVNDDFQSAVSPVVGVPDRVSVAVDDNLSVGG
ncbi:hypothetical protein P5E35_14580, partial [Clostridium perfringens]|nr:hypothetical protein [Clostridium perfringens]